MRPALRRAAVVATAVLISMAALGSLIYLGYRALRARLYPYVIAHAARHLTDEERRALYQQVIDQSGGELWEVDPDPLIGRVGRRFGKAGDGPAAVRLNNAGMRDKQTYAPPHEGLFRIVCVGDSHTFGLNGPEEDRYCDQIEAFYREHDLRAADGRKVESYVAASPGWTLLQGVAYLTSRLSDYDPDLIVILTSTDDVGDSLGVLGTGALTDTYSSEERQWGSGNFHLMASQRFDEWQTSAFDPEPQGDGYAAVSWDLSPESARRWDRSMRQLKRLVDAQARRGKHTLLSVLSPDGFDFDPFVELYRKRVRDAGIELAPLPVSYLRSENFLPQDPGHTNRRGNALLRDQYVLAIHRMGVIRIPAQHMPAPDPRVPPDGAQKLPPERLKAWQEAFVRTHVHDSFDFAAPKPGQVRSMLGGIRPDKPFPWASLRAGFLLKRPSTPAPHRLEVILEAPPRAELYPMTIEVNLDGFRAAESTLESPDGKGRHRIEVWLPTGPNPVVEVVLTTTSRFATFEDPVMKSYRLVSARIY